MSIDHLASGSYVPGEVISRDGTAVAFRRYGTHGPAIILVHGGAQAAQNFSRLAAALAEEFTVYVPDRRGRGRSGSPGEHYGLGAEREDIAALVAHSGAVDLFGLSSGAIIVLSAARHLPGLRSVAVYEPPLSINHSTPLGWLPRYERELAAGNLGAAAVTAIRGTRTASLALRLVPRPLITMALNAATRPGPDGPGAAGAATVRRSPWRVAVLRVLLWPLRRAASSSRAGAPPAAPEVPLRDLVATMRYDAQLVAESEGTLGDYAGLDMPVLLLGGERSAGYLRHSLDALERVLPRVARVEFPRTGHLAADDTGDPLRVAAELRRFFE